MENIKKHATNKIRSSRPEVFWNNVFVDISKNSQESTCARVSFLINEVAALRPAILLKKTLAQVFSCEFCEVYKTTFFHRTLVVAASVKYNFMLN